MAKEALKAWKQRCKEIKVEFLVLCDIPRRSPLEERRKWVLVSMMEAMDASRPGSSSTSSSGRNKGRGGEGHEGSYCDSGGSCFTCFAELAPKTTTTVSRLPRGIMLVMGAFMMVPVWVRIVFLVALASLVLQDGLPREQLSLCFRLPRGTLAVMGATVLLCWYSSH